MKIRQMLQAKNNTQHYISVVVDSIIKDDILIKEHIVTRFAHNPQSQIKDLLT